MEELTDLELAAYRDNENLCPYCSSDDLWMGNPTSGEGGILIRYARCANCQKTWDEIFQMIGVGKRMFTELDEPIGFEKDSFLWIMWLDAIKVTGKMSEAISYIEESLTKDQYDKLENFVNWLLLNQYTVGHGNYYDHYQEYRKEQGEIVND